MKIAQGKRGTDSAPKRLEAVKRSSLDPLQRRTAKPPPLSTHAYSAGLGRPLLVLPTVTTFISVAFSDSS